ncbi:hypothetical protein EC844_103166 [Acinetobacter calcoaceticus]|uniref:Lipoprotein n=1 Tax=Acinetobacter calcoaceticus TaxID=471 RepID=A0A4R1XZD8_ACICA|nr:hypothetical protein EC844_103166 [Acinetobacter calcoaceticus]
MARFFGCSIVLGISGLVLSGCQTTQSTVDRIRIKQAQTAAPNAAQIYCSGTANCEFERVDKLSVVDATSKRINTAVIKTGWLGLTGQPMSSNGLFLRLPPQQHEVVIRFYPISAQHAEVFHVIHQFKPQQRYDFKMYRQAAASTGSLLNVSTPKPLCVDLLQEQRLIRRFCRPYDVVTGVSEFVEKKI